MNPAEWPWYEVVDDDSLDQGDIIPGCLVLHAVEGEEPTTAVAELRPVTALVVTQTCDLAQNKVESVVLCAVWSIARAVLVDPTLGKQAAETAKREQLLLPAADAAEAEVETKVSAVIERSKALKKELNAMKGERPSVAMLARHDGSPAAPASLVNFEQVYSLPRAVLEAAASKAKPRLRLLPPYREHISLAFGRYFTRVGLFQDIRRYST